MDQILQVVYYTYMHTHTHTHTHAFCTYSRQENVKCVHKLLQNKVESVSKRTTYFSIVIHLKRKKRYFWKKLGVQIFLQLSRSNYVLLRWQKIYMPLRSQFFKCSLYFITSLGFIPASRANDGHQRRQQYQIPLELSPLFLLKKKEKVQVS